MEIVLIYTIFRSAMTGLAGARPETIVRHLPLIFDTIIQLLVQPPRLSDRTLNIGYVCFEAICLLLENISVKKNNFTFIVNKINDYLFLFFRIFKIYRLINIPAMHF